MTGFYDVSEMRKSLINSWDMQKRSTEGCSGRHLLFGGKIAKFFAKIERNRKIFVVFIFEDKMV